MKDYWFEKRLKHFSVLHLDGLKPPTSGCASKMTPQLENCFFFQTVPVDFDQTITMGLDWMGGSLLFKICNSIFTLLCFDLQFGPGARGTNQRDLQTSDQT